MANATKINGQQPTFGDLEFLIDGIGFVEVTAIDYSMSNAITPIHTVGKTPRFYTKGNKSYTGSITLVDSGLRILENAAKLQGLKDITDLGAFSIIIKSQMEGSIPTIDILNDVMFLSDGRGSSANSTDSLSHQISLFIGSITFNLAV